MYGSTSFATEAERTAAFKSRAGNGVMPVEEHDSIRFAAGHLADPVNKLLIVRGSAGPIGVFSQLDLARAVADGVDVDRVAVGTVCRRT